MLSSRFDTPDALVPTSTKGTPINTSRLRLAFKAFLKRSGLPDIRFQDLRHNYAPLLLSKGIHPKIVSEQLGHANIGITLDTYSHVLPGMEDAAADAMDEVLNRAYREGPGFRSDRRLLQRFLVALDGTLGRCSRGSQPETPPYSSN